MLHGLHVPLWKLWTARPQNVFEIGQIEIGHRIRTRQGMPCKRLASLLGSNSHLLQYYRLRPGTSPDKPATCQARGHECYKTNSESSPFVPASTVSKPVHAPSKIPISWKHLYHVWTFLSMWIINLTSFLAGQHLTIQPLLQGSCKDLGKQGAWETPMMLMVSVLWYHHYHTSFTTYTNIITSSFSMLSSILSVSLLL